jgi:precorrin-6x reductase
MYTGVNTDEMFVIQYRMPQVKQNAAKGTLSTVVCLSQLIQELNQACMQEARVVLLMTGSSALDKFSIPEFETIVRVQLERGAVVITNWPNLSHLATQCITVSKP